MFKIDNSTAATTLPATKPVGPKPGGFFQHGDASGEDVSDLPTNVAHDWANAIQEEICYVLEQAEIEPDKHDRTQLYEAINALAVGAGGGEGILLAVEDDPNPTLGGDLEVNDKKIKSASGNILVEATSGNIDLNTPTVLVATEIAHRGDTNNKIGFGTDTQTLTANGSNILDISSSGLRLGGGGARVTTISNDDTMTADSSTLVPTQYAVRKYFVDNSGVLTTPEDYYLYFKGSLNSAGGSTYIYAVTPPALSTGEYEIDVWPDFWLQTPSTLGGPNNRYNFLFVSGSDDGGSLNSANFGTAQSNEGMYVTTTDGFGPAWSSFVGSNGTTPLLLTLQMFSQSPTPPGRFTIRIRFRRVA